jgi:hypothetical protein
VCHTYTPALTFIKHWLYYLLFDCRGVSSTVRKCVEKATSKDFAVKVIDLTNEKNDVLSPEEMVAITRKEMHILRICAGQPYIS